MSVLTTFFQTHPVRPRTVVPGVRLRVSPREIVRRIAAGSVDSPVLQAMGTPIRRTPSA
ncbi:hypothetical protein [Streptomyces sp. UNOC14_S4]|uniref:hypothetical protein n=1 Tax=Streptomyces sp. UNOC14_S4 TaxID=2872340 RepID=UPI001E3BB32B|nr:hypothetical protein [Streptomyces sp. UNOC14_S4]MCC3771100.1 hypothetical protein [Streptomyces sp. UNOC14_S4]